MIKSWLKRGKEILPSFSHVFSSSSFSHLVWEYPRRHMDRFFHSNWSWFSSIYLQRNHRTPREFSQDGYWPSFRFFNASKRIPPQTCPMTFSSRSSSAKSSEISINLYRCHMFFVRKWRRSTDRAKALIVCWTICKPFGCKQSISLSNRWIFVTKGPNGGISSKDAFFFFFFSMKTIQDQLTLKSRRILLFFFFFFFSSAVNSAGKPCCSRSKATRNMKLKCWGLNLPSWAFNSFSIRTLSCFSIINRSQSSNSNLINS